MHSFDSILLPLAVGTTPKKTFLYTTFLIVDCPIAYNVIINRPTLTKMKAFLAPHMLMMKLPTHFGVGQVRGDQLSTRTWYVFASSSSTTTLPNEALTFSNATPLLPNHKRGN
ncbi:unnamed protein product [Prunus armeniaca]